GRPRWATDGAPCRCPTVASDDLERSRRIRPLDDEEAAMTDTIPTTDTARLLSRTAELATDYLLSLAERPVRPRGALPTLRAAMGGPVPEGPADPLDVVEALVSAADPGIVAT